ncbi:hypothetical protein GcM1_164001 [Golovinomyces cichoracearum]|uniref:Uncharacterized protein n=1 Tax=Golovinomyces cichoracearum TaxID=62708 RepID=A0A420J879_9PEZI|nr:hypothetical protein GcM1_164001 [Golovinomyces cichoracearum]
MSTISTYGTLAFLVEVQTTVTFNPRDQTATANPDYPFYPYEGLPTSNDLSALSRLGNEHDIRLGVASFCIHYHNITDVSF